MRVRLLSIAHLLVAAGVLLVVPTIAPGQTPQSEPSVPELPADAPVPAPPPPPGDIEAIEITGEREETSVQDEAEAVTRFGMEDLDKLNISNVDGLAANVPGLHVGQQGQAAIVTLRGIGTENASITGESGVAFHVDGIYFARPTAARVAFYDIHLIDVKRGPQGFLGGKNSTSGAINVETNDPSQEYEVEGDVLFGNYDRVRSRGVINIPFGELAAFRTAVFYEDRDGYLDNKTVSDSRDPFDVDNFGFRSKLRISPTDSVDFVLGYNYFKETGNGPQADLVPIVKTYECGPFDPWGPAPPPIPKPKLRYTTGLPVNLACNQLAEFVRDNLGRLVRIDLDGDGRKGEFFHTPAAEDRDPRDTYANLLSAQDDRYWGAHGRLTWDTAEIPLLGATEVDLRGGYQRTETVFDWDFDSSSIEFFPLDTSSLSHEYVADVRWHGTTLDEKLEWQTSLFFAREAGDSLTVTKGFEVDVQGGDQGGENKVRSDQSVENKSYGAALHGAYHVGDAVTFKLGGRWIKDRKRSLLARVAANDTEACRGYTAKQLKIIPQCDLTDRGTMWGSALEWRPLDGQVLYVAIDRGLKSGGFRLGGVGNYGEERIWAYSAGSKSTLFDGRLQVNLEGFFYNYQDMQLALIDGTQTRTENADTRMYGVEIEANAEPVEGLRLGAVLGHLKTELIDYFSLDPASLDDGFLTDLLVQRADAERHNLVYAEQRKCTDPQTGATNRRCGDYGDKDGLFDFSGNELSRAPKWKVTLQAEYEIPIGRFGSLTPRVHYSWQDETYFRVFNRDFDLQEAYHKTDAKLLWESPEHRWSAEIFVENIEDAAVKDYILIGSRVFNSPPLAWYNEPRFYGVRMGFKY
jgi:iron complex outermembrane receptor protein